MVPDRHQRGQDDFLASAFNSSWKPLLQLLGRTTWASSPGLLSLGGSGMAETPHMSKTDKRREPERERQKASPRQAPTPTSPGRHPPRGCPFLQVHAPPPPHPPISPAPGTSRPGAQKGRAARPPQSEHSGHSRFLEELESRNLHPRALQLPRLTPDLCPPYPWLFLFSAEMVNGHSQPERSGEALGPGEAQASTLRTPPSPTFPNPVALISPSPLSLSTLGC